MILLADSGSTRCDWRWIDQDGSLLSDFSTPGFNPVSHSGEYFRKLILRSGMGKTITGESRLVGFFGAGLGSESRIDRARKMLKVLFPAAYVVVGSDLDASAIASLDGETGVCCILGTGSNAGLYKGPKLLRKLPSGGYLVGDEGSGNYFGKILLNHIIYDSLPTHIRNEVQAELGSDPVKLIDELYSTESPAAYLGEIGSLMVQMKDDEWVEDQLCDGLSAFLIKQVKPLLKEEKHPLYVTGSLGVELRGIFEGVALELGYNVERFIQRPVEELDCWAVKQLEIKKAQQG